METEHCSGPSSTMEFTTKNYGITTDPSKEWNIVLGRTECPQKDHDNDRRIPNIDELLGLSTSKEAELNRAEVISVVLYSGPMVGEKTFFLRLAKSLILRSRSISCTTPFFDSSLKKLSMS
jgi:hypothetical protein